MGCRNVFTVSKAAASDWSVFHFGHGLSQSGDGPPSLRAEFSGIVRGQTFEDNLGETTKKHHRQIKSYPPQGRGGRAESRVLHKR